MVFYAQSTSNYIRANCGSSTHWKKKVLLVLSKGHASWKKVKQTRLQPQAEVSRYLGVLRTVNQYG